MRMIGFGVVPSALGPTMTTELENMWVFGASQSRKGDVKYYTQKTLRS